MSNRKYLSAAETAKLVRAALKESFPGVKFSVRSSSYSGGASIRVDWLDGPSARQVKAITDRFEGAYFDGMIDYKGSRYHLLDGQEVHFGANFIFADREYSDALVAEAIAAVVGQYGGAEPISVEDYRKGRAWHWQNEGGVDMARALSLALGRIDDDPWHVKVGPDVVAQPSPTLARVQFIGDDGYGQGTVGRYFIGGDKCAQAVSERQAVQS